MHIHKNILFPKKIFLVTLIIMAIASLQRLFSQTLNGPQSVEVGTTNNYYIYHTVEIVSYEWSTTNGTVLGSAANSAAIKWNTTPSGVVYADFTDANNTTFHLTLSISVNNPPPNIPGKPQLYTNGCGQASLQRVGTPPDGVKWYWQGKNSQGMNDAASAEATSQPYPLTLGNGVYYIRAKRNSGEWSTSQASDFITIKNLTGGTITTSKPTICYGQTPASITSVAPASGTDGTYSYQWYYDSFDGNGWQPIDGANGVGYTPQGTHTNNISYQRRVTCGNQTQVSNSIDVQVHGQVLSPSTSQGKRCGPGVVQISAIPGNNSDRIRWYAVSSGGNELTEGVSSDTRSYTTPYLSTTTTYYVESYDSDTGCFSGNRKSVQAKINPTPSLAVAADPPPKCGPNVFTLSATPGDGGNTIKWYNASSGGALKHTGLNYTTTSQPVGTTTYYAASYNNDTQCEDNDRVPVTVTVYAVPELPEIRQEPGPEPATCSNPNGSFFIENYNGALNDYVVTSSTGDIYTGGPSFNLPEGVYYVTSITKGSSCTSNSVQVDLRNLSGPFAPPPPNLLASTTPVCSTAKGTFSIQNYSSGNEYLIYPSDGVSEPYYDSDEAEENKRWKVTAPPGTYTVSSRRLNSNCTSSTSSITIDSVNIPCGGAECSIDPSTSNTLYFGSGSQNVNWSIIGNTECALQVTQVPSWISSYTVQQDNATINFISEANTLGDMEDIIQVRQDGGHIFTITVLREHGPDYPGNPNPPIIDPNDCSQKTLLPPGKESDETIYWQGQYATGQSDNEIFDGPKTVNQSGTYYIRAKKGDNWSTKLAQIYIDIKSVPEIPIVVVKQSSCSTELATITITNLDSGNQVSFNNGASYEPVGTNSKSGFDQGNYSIKVKSSDGCESEAVIAIVDQAPSNDCGTISFSGNNYIYTRTFQKSAQEMLDQENIDQETFDFFTESAGVIQNITYFDGLGRPLQQIGIDQSMDNSGEWNDLITHIGYDDFGRQHEEWLPVPDSNGDLGSFRTQDLKAQTRQYYKNHPDYSEDFTNLTLEDANPYSRKLFEPSPLNRVLKQAAPGEDWKLNENGYDHSIELGYFANHQNPNNLGDPLNDNVRLFTVGFQDDGSGNSDTEKPLLEENDFYAQGELYKNITRDENHTTSSGKLHTTEEFTDKQGRVVLKRTYADIPAIDKNNDGDTFDPGEAAMAQAPHDTYYVYDDYGNLTYVLPPKMDATEESLVNLNAMMNDLGYQYVYDHRNRLVEKRIPGKGWEYIVYNLLDLPVMTQDANMRTESNSSINVDQWLFTKYDAFGRVIYTGIIENNNDRSDMVGIVEGSGSNIPDQYESPLEVPIPIDGIDLYYTNTAKPINIIELYTVNYYDDYDYLESESGLNLPNSVFAKNLMNFNNLDKIKTKSLATGSKVKVLDTSDWIILVVGYDEKARSIYTYSENEYLETVDIVETELDFTGKPVKVKTTHSRSGNDIVTIDNFKYDRLGRLLSQSQCVGDAILGDSCPENASIPENIGWDGQGDLTQDQEASKSITVKNAIIKPGINNVTVLRIVSSSLQELIAYNNYDELGKLKTKKVGGSYGLSYDAISGLQEISYRYNIRGWLTGINDVADAGTDKLFKFGIGYNDPQHGGAPLYNGNISETLWRTANIDDSSLKYYAYGYDPLNRITAATDNTGKYNVSGITYDKNGNIQTLKREGWTVASPSLENNTGFGTMDDLTYTYQPNGNKLSKVVDGAAIDQFGFRDDAENMTPDNGIDFYYDQNGNMTSDLNKGITDIDYNHLNLPTNVTVTGSNAGTVTYIYDADGVKLKEIAQNSAGITETEYASGKVYENGSLQFFGHPEGYVDVDNGNFNYVYNYVDHLGNVRLSYTDSNSDGSIDSVNEIIEENNYYPFGMKHQGYNGNVSSLGNSVAKQWKFNGKELNQELGLDWYDYGMRMYDPAIARFMTVDIATELMKQYTPYSYSFNSPVMFEDKDGNFPTLAVFGGTDPIKKLMSGPKVDMTNAPKSSPTNAKGFPRNNRWFWSQMAENNPQMFSAKNKALIKAGQSPVIDPKWVEFNPSHAGYKGKLVHHHIDQGRFAVGIPEEAHRQLNAKLHPRTGSKARGFFRGTMKFMNGIVLGLAVFDLFSDNPESLGNLFAQSSGNIEEGKIYKNRDGGFYSISDREFQKNEDGEIESVTAKVTLYRDYRYNEETGEYEGVGQYDQATVKQYKGRQAQDVFRKLQAEMH